MLASHGKNPCPAMGLGPLQGTVHGKFDAEFDVCLDGNPTKIPQEILQNT